MIYKAEQAGKLKPGHSVIIEPTSGNTGIGLALLASLRGYRCIITLPAKMSKEKEAILRSLGAEVVRTRTEAGPEDEDSHIMLAQKLAREIPGGIILDQYANHHNPLAHYFSTYAEIKNSLQTSNLSNKKIDALVAGAGTGGTITGLSRALRDDENGIYPRPESEEDEIMKRVAQSEKKIENTEGGAKDTEQHLRDQLKAGRGLVVAVDPEGSILGGGTTVGSYQIEGIGYDFIPDVLDTSENCVDKWIKCNDEEAFQWIRETMKSESLLIGGSSGSALTGLFKFLKETQVGREMAEDETKNVVVLLADGVRNYISKVSFFVVSPQSGGG